VLDGVRTVDVDLTAVAFCDAGGLDAFLAASRLATDAGTALRLHCPPPAMARIIEITGSGFLLHEPLAVRPSPGRVPPPRAVRGNDSRPRGASAQAEPPAGRGPRGDPDGLAHENRTRRPD